MKNLLPLILLTLTIVLLYSYPPISFIGKHGLSYSPLTTNGISPFGRDEGYAYAPLVNYILKGNLKTGEAYIKEYKDTPSPFMGETAPSVMLAVLSRVTGSIDRGFILADFIFPAVIFLLLYKITRQLISNKFFAGVTAFVSSTSRDLVSVLPYPHETLQLLTFSEGQNFPLYLSRAFHPQVTFGIFCAFILFLYMQLNEPKNIKKVILTSLALALLFYSYIFYWTYALFYVGLLMLYSLIKKQHHLLKSLVITTLIALLFAAPYLLNINSFYSLELSRDFLEKSSLPGLPIPLTLARYLLVAAVFWLLFKKNKSESYVFALLLTSGVLISPTTKLILGQDLETFHFLRRALMPFSTIAVFSIIYLLVKKNKLALNALSIILLITFSLVAINTQVVSSNVIETSQLKNKSEQDVFDYLTQNAKETDVIGSVDNSFNLFISVYTNSFTFVPPSDRTVMPTYENIERFVAISNLLGLTKEDQKSIIKKSLSYFFIYQAYDQNHNLDINSEKRFQAEETVERYNYENYHELISKYELDYVVLTPEHSRIAAPDLNFLEKTADINGYTVYKMK